MITIELCLFRKTKQNRNTFCKLKKQTAPPAGLNKVNLEKFFVFRATFFAFLHLTRKKEKTV